MFICKHLIDVVDLKNTAEIRDMLTCTPYMYYLLAVSHRSAWLPQHAAVKTKSETDRENQNDPDCSTSVVYVQGQSPWDFDRVPMKNLHPVVDLKSVVEPRGAASHRRTKLVRDKRLRKTLKRRQRGCWRREWWDEEDVPPTKKAKTSPQSSLVPTWMISPRRRLCAGCVVKTSMWSRKSRISNG